MKHQRNSSHIETKDENMLSNNCLDLQNSFRSYITLVYVTFLLHEPSIQRCQGHTALSRGNHCQESLGCERSEEIVSACLSEETVGWCMIGAIRRVGGVVWEYAHGWIMIDGR